MTLLEALIALVILGLAAVGYVDVFQGGARSVQSADEWARIVAVAESTMDNAVLGAAPAAQASAQNPEFTRQVEVRPWSDKLAEVVVTVVSPRGIEFRVHRLVRTP